MPIPVVCAAPVEPLERLEEAVNLDGRDDRPAVSQHWSVLVPALACYGGLGAALVIGTIVGLYPAMRAAGLSPTEALRTV